MSQTSIEDFLNILEFGENLIFSKKITNSIKTSLFQPQQLKTEIFYFAKENIFSKKETNYEIYLEPYKIF